MTCWVLAVNFGWNKVQVDGIAQGWGGFNVRKGQIKLLYSHEAHGLRKWRHLQGVSLAWPSFPRFLSHLQRALCFLFFPPSLQRRSSTCTQAFMVANEPHIKPVQVSLGFALWALASCFMFIKVRKKERLMRGGARQNQRSIHQGHFTPMKRSRCFSCHIFHYWRGWDVGVSSLAAPKAQVGGSEQKPEEGQQLFHPQL